MPPFAVVGDVDDDPSTASRKRGRVRLLRKLPEVDPLRGPRCGTEIKVDVFINATVVDSILAHLQGGRGHEPFEPRAPLSGEARAP